MKCFNILSHTGVTPVLCIQQCFNNYYHPLLFVLHGNTVVQDEKCSQAVTANRSTKDSDMISFPDYGSAFHPSGVIDRHVHDTDWCKACTRTAAVAPHVHTIGELKSTPADSNVAQSSLILLNGPLGTSPWSRLMNRTLRAPAIQYIFPLAATSGVRSPPKLWFF